MVYWAHNLVRGCCSRVLIHPTPLNPLTPGPKSTSLHSLSLHSTHARPPFLPTYAPSSPLFLSLPPLHTLPKHSPPFATFPQRPLFSLPLFASFLPSSGLPIHSHIPPSLPLYLHPSPSIHPTQSPFPPSYLLRPLHLHSTFNLVSLHHSLSLFH